MDFYHHSIIPVFHHSNWGEATKSLHNRITQTTIYCGIFFLDIQVIVSYNCKLKKLVLSVAGFR